MKSDRVSGTEMLISFLPKGVNRTMLSATALITSPVKIKQNREKKDCSHLVRELFSEVCSSHYTSGAVIVPDFSETELLND